MKVKHLCCWEVYNFVGQLDLSPKLFKCDIEVSFKLQSFYSILMNGLKKCFLYYELTMYQTGC